MKDSFSLLLFGIFVILFILFLSANPSNSNALIFPPKASIEEILLLIAQDIYLLIAQSYPFVIIFAIFSILIFILFTATTVLLAISGEVNSIIATLHDYVRRRISMNPLIRPKLISLPQKDLDTLLVEEGRKLLSKEGRLVQESMKLEQKSTEELDTMKFDLTKFLPPL